MIGDLTGKRALVTGAAQGLGWAIAARLAGQGAVVMATDLSSERVQEKIGAAALSRVTAATLDVTSADSVRAAFDNAFSILGGIDILVNNAGVSGLADSDGDTDEDWDFAFNVNVKGVRRCCKEVVPRMAAQRSGRIINIGSISGHASRRTTGAYPATKAALLRYTRSLAYQLAPSGITVNAVCPGAVWTPFHKGPAVLEPEEEARRYQAFVAKYADLLPLGRPQDADEVAIAAAYLGSDDARSITGQCLHVDGGAVIRD